VATRPHCELSHRRLRALDRLGDVREVEAEDLAERTKTARSSGVRRSSSRSVAIEIESASSAARSGSS
jgi:hypothetical protein